MVAGECIGRSLVECQDSYRTRYTLERQRNSQSGAKFRLSSNHLLAGLHRGIAVTIGLEF